VSVRAEEKLRSTKKRLQILFDKAIDGIALAETETGILVECNNTFADMLEMKKSEVIGRHQSTLHPEKKSDTEFSETFAAHLKGKEGAILPDKIITKSGIIKDVEIRSNQIEIDGKEHLLGIFRDVTEYNRLRAQLQQSQKMEAIGTMAGGIAHDFNNLLTSIQINASMILHEVDHGHKFYELLNEINNAVSSGAKLTSQLLGYARKSISDIQPINFNKLIKDISEGFGRTKKGIPIQVDLSDDLFNIEADMNKLQQVFLNLLINACDAMSDTGNITLKTKNVTDRDMKGKLYDPVPGNYVKLTVNDTGKGMDKETTRRIFEPFFTTKEIGKGTGLGLASAYGIIKEHKGYIDVDSKPGIGTTFTLYLPATDKEIEETLQPSLEIFGGTGTVLIVDDEKSIRKVLIRLIKSFGYNFYEAGSGKEAIEIYEKNKDEIDLVLLDMIMPEMSGEEVFERLRKITPDIKIIISSGYSADGKAKKIMKKGCQGFLPKPFDIKELSKKIKEVLENI